MARADRVANLSDHFDGVAAGSQRICAPRSGFVDILVNDSPGDMEIPVCVEDGLVIQKITREHHVRWKTQQVA